MQVEQVGRGHGANLKGEKKPRWLEACEAGCGASPQGFAGFFRSSVLRRLLVPQRLQLG